MSMSDCRKCWGTPCTCGWDYRNYLILSLYEKIAMLTKVIVWKKQHPEAKFSNICEPETNDDKSFMEYMYKK